LTTKRLPDSNRAADSNFQHPFLRHISVVSKTKTRLPQLTLLFEGFQAHRMGRGGLAKAPDFAIVPAINKCGQLATTEVAFCQIAMISIPTLKMIRQGDKLGLD